MTQTVEEKKFTINELERFSGIKAHTLRAWERRYALLQPDRSEGNCRRYSLHELEKILNVALLKRNGYRISRLAQTASIEDKIRSLSNDYDNWQKAINELTINMYMQDIKSFELALDKLLLMWPIETLIEKIIFPFLKITGLLWIGHKLFEEHTVVTATRKKLILAIESENLAIKTGKTVLLFLPDTKQLDLGLLYSNYFLKRRGIHILYLGNDITIQNLKLILHIDPPAYLFTYLPKGHHFPVERLLGCIKESAPYSKLIIGSYSVEYTIPFFSDNLVEMSYIEALEFLHASCK